MTTIDKAALLAKVKASGEDQTKIEEFKDSGPVLVEGLHNARFVAYIEVGKHSAMYQGKPKKTPDDLVYLGFEFSGPKVVPREDGQPIVLFIKANKSFNSKSGFPKIMTRMNYAGKATHMAELLGEPYQIMISHSKKTVDGKERTYVNMKKPGEPHDIRAPRYEVQDENGPTGEFKIINVAPAKAPEMLFLWDFADMAQWQSIFIDGEYAERKDEKTGEVTKPAKSKNFYQSLIKSAKNFNGSPIHTLLVAGGVSLDIPDAEAPGHDGEDDDGAPDETATVGTKAPVDTPTGAAADDALSGVA